MVLTFGSLTAGCSRHLRLEGTDKAFLSAAAVLSTHMQDNAQILTCGGDKVIALRPLPGGGPFKGQSDEGSQSARGIKAVKVLGLLKTDRVLGLLKTVRVLGVTKVD